MTLSEYTKIAKNIIHSYFANSNYKYNHNEDLICDVVNAVALADINYNGKSNIHYYRRLMAIYAILAYLQKQRKEYFKLKKAITNFVPSMVMPQDLASDIELKTTFDKIFESGLLTSRQKECIIDYYYNGLNTTEIGKKLNMTRQAVSLFIKLGLKKINEYYGEQLSNFL